MSTGLLRCQAEELISAGGGTSVTHPAEQAVRAFWAARETAAARQAAAGRSDAGTRSAVTAGGHLAALEDIVVNEFIAAGFAPDSVRRTTPWMSGAHTSRARSARYVRGLATSSS